MALALRPALAVLIALCAYTIAAATFVMFYAPLRSHCTDFAPTWAVLADTLGEIHVAKVDYASEARAQMCTVDTSINTVDTLVTWLTVEGTASTIRSTIAMAYTLGDHLCIWSTITGGGDDLRVFFW